MGRKRPDPTESMYPALETGVDAAGRTIFFFGGIDDEAVARAVVALEVFDRTDGPVRIVLCSSGGDVPAGMTLYDAIRMAHNPVIIDVYGECKSMAVLVLQAGSLRRASPESRLMVHQGSVGLDPVPTGALGDISREIERMHDRYCEILAERSGQPIRSIQRLCSKESYMSVDAAKELGLLDETMATYNPMKISIRKVKRR